MTKIIQAKYKISRRFGVNLWGRAKDAFERRNYAPGQHGQAGNKRAKSNFGTQLAAKQKLKGYYGNISEKQFRKTYQEAIRRRGDTSEQLIALLEQRLDAVVYRMNFAPTIFAARQLVSHKHVKVNGKTVNIASFRVEAGMQIEIKEASKQMPIVVEAAQQQERPTPDYIEVDPKALKGTFVRVPKPDEVPYATKMEPNLVVEFYSR